jgi:hypothetical protein
MAARRWSIRSYNAFLAGAKAKHGLTQAEARVAYKTTAERLGRPARAVDITRHPVIVKQEAKKAVGAPERARRAKIQEAQRSIAKMRREDAAKAAARAAKKKGVAPGAEAGAPPGKGKDFKTLADYTDWYDDYEDDYYYEEADGTVDY